MPARRIYLSPALVCLLSVAAGLSAQAPNYHLELTDGTSGYVILVNDSAKTIEAFHLKATCGNSSSSPYYDAVSTPQSTIGPDGDVIGPFHVIAPGERMKAHIRFPPYPNGCLWKVDIDGVIYSDGTYEGSDDGVRSLQGWRDGLAAELRYWSTKLHQETPVDPYAIAKEAHQRADTYMHEPYRGPIHSLLYYRFGEQVVASSLAVDTSRKPSPQKLFNRELDVVDRWQKKLDDDVAFKKMNTIFPLPADVATSAARPPAVSPSQP